LLSEEEIKSFLDAGKSSEVGIRKVKFPSLGPVKGMDRVKTSLSHLEDVHIEVSIELGETILKVKEVLGLVEGSVIKLNRVVGDEVELILNNQRFARGEVIIINDLFGVRLISINQAQNLELTEGLV